MAPHQRHISGHVGSKVLCGLLWMAARTQTKFMDLDERKKFIDLVRSEKKYKDPRHNSL